jgi:nucleoside-diphosphate-sugar epimerase
MRPHDGRAIPTFLRQAVEGKPVTVFGDGQQTRSFCYVEDLIRGIHALAMSTEFLPVNLGNPEERTLVELAETVIRLVGSSSQVVFEGARDARMGARGAARGRSAADDRLATHTRRGPGLIRDRPAHG